MPRHGNDRFRPLDKRRAVFDMLSCLSMIHTEIEPGVDIVNNAPAHIITDLHRDLRVRLSIEVNPHVGTSRFVKQLLDPCVEHVMTLVDMET